MSQIPRSVKFAGRALGCAGAAIAAPALAPYLAASGLGQLLGGLVASDELRKSLGNLVPATVAGIFTNLGSDEVQKLREALSKEHNYDLERALAAAYLDALKALAAQAEDKGDEQLRRQFDGLLPRWESRIKRGLKDENLAAFFPAASRDGDPAASAAPQYGSQFHAEQFILKLSDESGAEKLIADEVENTLRRWADEEAARERSGKQNLLGLSAQAHIPAELLAYLRHEMPAEIPYRFGQVIRSKEFERSWIAFHTAHLRSISGVLSRIEVQGRATSLDIGLLTARIDRLAALPGMDEKLAEELAELLSRARDDAAARESLAAEIAGRLLGLEDRLSSKIDDSTERLSREGRESEERVIAAIKEQAANISSAPFQLRRPVDDFVGRRDEIEKLTAALRSGQHAAISGISGMSGIGKTELALLVADRLKADYPDAQLFVSLRGTEAQPRDSADALAFCLRALLGPEARLPDDADDLAALYRTHLTSKRALILLDNAANDRQVRPLVPPPGSALLVTSRELIALPQMTRVTLEQLHPDEARALLVGLAPQTAESVADQICYLCGYLPLAVRAAGSLIAVTVDLDPAVYAAELGDERTRLEAIGEEGVDVGVEASLNLSYARLAGEAARVFRQLAVFPASFDAKAAEAVCADAGHKHLSELVRRSLVLYSGEKKRYRLHDLARIFAGRRLSQTERETAERAHANYYVQTLSAAGQLYLAGGESVVQGLTLFDLERENVEAGHQWAAARAGYDQAAARLVVDYPDAGVYVLNLRQHLREWMAWFESALIAARGLGDKASEGNALGNLGLAYANLGEVRRAIEYYEQSLLIAKEIGDRLGEGNVLGNLGTAYRSLGEVRRAIEYHDQKLTIAKEIGDRLGEGIALFNLSLALDSLGEREQATTHAITALKLFEQIESPRVNTVRQLLEAWGIKAE